MIFIQGSDRVVEVDIDVAESEFNDLPARVSRAANLDGTATISHQGFSHGDRTFYIRKKPISKTLESDLQYLQKNETTLRLANSEGVFYGSIEQLSTNNGELNLTFLVGGSDTDN